MIFLCILNTFLSLSSFNGCESRQGIYFTHKRGQMFFWSKNFRLHISTKPKNHTHTHIHSSHVHVSQGYPFCQLFQNLFPWQSGINRNHIVAEETGMKLKTCKPCDGLSDMRWTLCFERLGGSRVDVAEV